MGIEKPYICDLVELQVTKIKYYKVMFKYSGKEYLIIKDDSDDSCISLYERQKVAQDRYVLHHIKSVYTSYFPGDLIRDISVRKPTHTVYSNVDRQYFVKRLAELDMVDGPYIQEFKKIREIERELNSKIRSIQNEISELYKEWRNTLNKGSKIIGDRLKIQASERVQSAKDGDWCKEYSAEYGSVHPEYGGVLTDLYSLPFGSCFFCTNGNWYGYIGCDKHGDKTVFTDNENVEPVKLTSDKHSLYIRRELNSTEIDEDTQGRLDNFVNHYINEEVPFN